MCPAVLQPTTAVCKGLQAYVHGWLQVKVTYVHGSMYMYIRMYVATYVHTYTQ